MISEAGDAHCEAVAAELRSRGVAVSRWDPATGPRAFACSIHLDPAGDQSIHGVVGTVDRELPLDQVESVWFRLRPSTLFLPLGGADDGAVFLSLELRAAFRALIDLTRSAFWVNSLDAVNGMESPVTQLNAAAATGLTVPRTLVTNDSDKAGEFCAALDGLVRVNSLRQDVPHQRALMHGARVLQEQITAAADVRVIKIGRRIYGLEKPSGSTALEYRACDVPAAVEARCSRLLEGWGLVFGAVNMIRRPNDDHLFVSCSANPDWLASEPPTTARAITSAVADLLQPNLHPR